MELPNGIFRARAVGGQLNETSTGKERVSVEFELLDEAYSGRRITWHGYFTDKTLEITVKALRACGWHTDDLADLSGLEINEVNLVVENEAYEGKIYPRVRWVNPIQSGPTLGAPLPVDRAKALAARMRAQILALEAGGGRKPTPKPTRAVAPAPSREGTPQGSRFDDSDIPY